jgi:hypothetical protein
MRPGDLPTVLLAATLMIVGTVSFRRGDFRGGVARVQRMCRPRLGTSPTDESVVTERAVRSVDVAAELLPTSITCLPRSVVTSAIVQHRGVEATLRIGVRIDAHEFMSHAWVESGGRPINDDPAALVGFEPFEESITPAVLAAMG